MTDKKILIKEFILNNPNLSGNDIYTQIKGTPLGIRKTDFYKIFRESKNLSEPSLAKKEASIPTKYKTTVQKAKVAKRKAIKTKQLKVALKPKRIPFEKTKFGKMTKDLMNKHGISESNAIIRLRKLLKLPKIDYVRLNQLDYDMLVQYGY